MLRSGRPREVLAQAHELVRAAPLRERRWELLVLAQYQTGAQGEALRSLRQLRAVLARELGIDPSPEMLALEQSILQQDPRLLVPPRSARAARCPWQGLMAYDVDDTERFFGRDADVDACLAILARELLRRAGGSVRIGQVLHHARRRAGSPAPPRPPGRPVTPGARPMQSLTALPEDAPPGTVLAVDQAEEVFALCDDLEERRTFLERLAEEARRRPVLVTVRGDRLAQVTEHAGFSRLVESGLHLVGALDEDGLRQAIERPAEQAGPGHRAGPGRPPRPRGARRPRRPAPALPRPARDLAATRGQHPDRRRLPRLRRHPWRRRPVRRAALRTDRARAAPSAARPDAAAGLPRRRGRSSPDPGPATPHRRLPTTQLSRLVAARLVTSDDGVLEITHEALARAWPRLRGWLDDDVEGQRIRHHLSGAADAWDTLGRPDSELYRGVRLTRALDWQSRTETALTETEREFLAAARVASDAEERSAAERARAQARLIRRLRIVLGGAAVLLVLALAAGGMAAVQSDRASENAARAEQAAVSADARRVGVRSQLTEDISLSLLLATAGSRLDDSPETRVNLVTALAERPRLVRSAPPEGGFLEVWSSAPTAAGSPPPTTGTGCTSTTAPPTGCWTATTQAGCRRPAGVHVRGVQSRQQCAGRRPRDVGVHRAGARPGPEHHGAHDTSPSRATSRSTPATCSSAPRVATWPPPCSHLGRGAVPRGPRTRTDSP